MSNLLKSIKNILTYQEPTNNEGFELLEVDSEYDAQSKKEESSGDAASKNNTAKEKKTSVTIEEWNEARKESQKTTKSSGDTVVKEIEINIERMKKEFNLPKNTDVIIRKFKLARKINACIVFVDGMVDKTIVNDFILRQLMTPEHFNQYNADPIMDYIVDNVLSINQVSMTKEYKVIIQQVLDGLTALFVDGSDQCLIVETRGYEKRSVEKPIIETVVKGSQEGFTENLRTNLTLVRRIVRNKNLITEFLPVGKTNNMSCGIMFIEGIANPKIIQEVKRRIKNINMDFIDGTEMLEHLIVESEYSLFPMVLTTERPDRTASLLMDGMVVIIAEGTPSAAAVPVSVFHLFHSPEDHYLEWQFATFIRFIRILGLITAFTLPGLYIALTLYHHEMIPTELLVAIKQARERVPFPTVIEVVVMEISFELIREAGIRVPGVIGNTLGIIGALILGQAAVSAGIVSPILIIVVAVTGLGNFTIPNYSFSFAIRVLRFIFITLGTIAGFYGISVGLVIIGGYACWLKSFGVPYLSPVAPKTKSSKSIFIKKPSFMENERPDYNNPLDRKRGGDEPREWLNKKQGGKEE